MDATALPPVAYLEPYGYLVDPSAQWAADSLGSGRFQRPQLTLTLGHHKERNGHTFYDVRCRLESGQGLIPWHSEKRLVQIREGLHSPAVKLLADYAQVFHDTPFALRGGVKGTSSRLDKWLRRLAECINRGEATPVLACQALQFFEAPLLPEHASAVFARKPGSSEGELTDRSTRSSQAQYHEQIQGLYLEELGKHFEFEAVERCCALCKQGRSGTSLLKEVLVCFAENLEDFMVRVRARDAVWDEEQNSLVPLDADHQDRFREKVYGSMEAVLWKALADAASAANDNDVSALHARKSGLRKECDQLLKQKSEATEEYEEMEEMNRSFPPDQHPSSTEGSSRASSPDGRPKKRGLVSKVLAMKRGARA